MARHGLAPAFADLDAEREVVLEEIAMYEDRPQELVHDLFAEAVFGGHALGRPVIGTAEVISSISRRRLGALPRRDVRAGQHRRRRGGQPRARRAASRSARAAGSAAPRSRSRGSAACAPPLVSEPPPGLRFQRKDTEQYHVCVGAPGISRSDQRRFAASLLDAILGGSASSRLFQEIREKRGMAYAVYSFALAVHRHRPGRHLRRHPRGEPRRSAWRSPREQIADIAAGNVRPSELERAKENLKGRIMLSMESTSNRMSRLGKSLITDTELLSFDRMVAEIDAVEPRPCRELAALLLAPRAALGRGHRAERGAVPRGRRARIEPGARRAAAAA